MSKFTDTVSIVKAAADNTRLRILMALQCQQELCACQLIELLRLAPATISCHMRILTSAGFVRSRKEGRWVYTERSLNYRFYYSAQVLREVYRGAGGRSQIYIYRSQKTKNNSIKHE